MGNSESTSNRPNLPVPNVSTLGVRPLSDHNYPSQKASLTAQKYNSVQNFQSNSPIPSVYKTPFGNNNKNAKENIPERVEYEIGPRSNVKAKITETAKPGSNAHKRLNSEDFDDSMIEENSDVTNKQKLNILDGHHGSAAYGGISKTESVLRPAANENRNKMQFSWNNSFTTNRTLANSNSQQTLSRNNNFQNKPTQRAPLSQHNMNIQTDRYLEGEESSSVRKHTFGKDTATNSDAKEIYIPSASRENREYYNDEVRIMETGYSSSRKVDTERDFFAGHPHNNEQIVKNLNKNYFADSQRTQGSTDSYGRGGSQYQYTLGKPVHSGLNRVEENIENPLNEKSEKKSTPSPQNVDSQDPSPMRIQKKINRPSQGNSRGGFPDVEFSFKPSTLKKDFSRANQENLDSARDSSRKQLSSQRSHRGSVQKSKSQTHKQNLPPIEILESESSYPDGPVSTGSESSLSNHPNQLHPQQYQIPHQKSLKARPHSSNQRRSTRSSHQHSHQMNDSLTYVVYPHSVKYTPGQQHIFPQPQSGLNSMPQTPLMSNVPSMPVLHMMNPADPSYPYMMNQQPPMYYPPPPHHPNSFAHQLPTYHMPHNYSYYYPQHPQHMNPMPPQSMSMYPQPGQYSNLQPMANNYGQSFASPPSNYSKVSEARHASYHERMPSRERLGGGGGHGDMTKNFSQYNLQNASNYASQPTENEDPRQLRQSKSLKSLRGVLNSNNNNGPAAKKEIIHRDAKTPEPKSEVSKPVIQTKAQSNKEKENEVGRIGKWKKTETENKALNETTISRINEVSRTRRPVNQEESEAGNELNMTEYSLVQKLESGGMFIKGISAISSPVARDDDFLKREYKNDGVLLFGNEKKKPGISTGKMEILTDKENDLMTWDIKDFMQNPTPNLPNANNTKTAMFDKIKSRLVKEKFKSTAEGCETPISKKDSVKMCFDFTPNRDNDPKLETNESKSIADYFKQSKGSLANKLEEENKRFSTISAITTKEFDKEELYQRRKSMMKSSKKNRDADALSNISQIRDFNNRTPDISSMGLSQISGFALSPMDTRKTGGDFLRAPSAGSKIEPNSRRNTSTLNSSLLERLAQGQKPKMTKKEMVALTAKNYQNLPEVKNKRDVQKKQEEKMKDLKERQDRVKDLDARLRRGKSAKRIAGDNKSHFF